MKLNGLDDLFTMREVKAQAVAGLLTAFTGEYPSIKRSDEFVNIKLSNKQIEKGQTLLRKLLGREPGEIRIQGLNDIMTPVFVKKYMGWIIGVPLALVVLGGIIKK